MRQFDVIFFDSVGVPFGGDTPRYCGLGGSEFEQILVAEELAKNGIKVACINRLLSWSRVRGVEYFPLEILSYEKFSCESLVLERSSPTPVSDCLSFDKKFRWVTDAVPMVEENESIICVSNWQASQIRNTDNKHVVYNMIPDSVYEVEKNRNTKQNSFIYASAAIKGLQQTLDYFSSMRKTKEFKNATLKVLNPGYDLPEKIKVDGVEFVGSVPFSKVIKEMLSCRSLLHVSTFKETFGIAHVLAEILGLNLFVLQANGPDALSEVCNSYGVVETQTGFNGKLASFANNTSLFKPVEPRDFRSSKIVKDWMNLLGFSCKSTLIDGQNHESGISLLVQPG